MQYDPIKNIFGNIVNQNPFLRKIFYKILGIMFLREWYVKRKLISLLKKSNKPLQIYDAGCGFGQYSYFIATHFPDVSIYGIDLKEDQIKACSAFFNTVGLNQCRFKVEDLTTITYAEEFNLILSVDVMEHIKDDIKVFQNFYRALKPHGILLINTPSDIGGSDVHNEKDRSFVSEHARNGYSIGDIQQKLQSAGFEIDTIEYTYGQWGMAAWRLGIKTPMRLLNISKLFFVVLPIYYFLTFPLFLMGMWIDYISYKKSGAGLLIVARKR